MIKFGISQDSSFCLEHGISEADSKKAAVKREIQLKNGLELKRKPLFLVTLPVSRN